MLLDSLINSTLQDKKKTNKTKNFRIQHSLLPLNLEYLRRRRIPQKNLSLLNRLKLPKRLFNESRSSCLFMLRKTSLAMNPGKQTHRQN